jgi:hypothetical protein
MENVTWWKNGASEDDKPISSDKKSKVQTLCWPFVTEVKFLIFPFSKGNNQEF